MPHAPLVVQLVIALLVLGIAGVSGVVTLCVVQPRLAATLRLTRIAEVPRQIIAVAIAFLLLLVVLFFGGMALGYWVIPPIVVPGN